MIGIYGVWVAGGAFVPLDPALPLPRMGIILEEIRSIGPVSFLTPDARSSGPGPGPNKDVFNIMEPATKSQQMQVLT